MTAEWKRRGTSLSYEIDTETDGRIIVGRVTRRPDGDYDVQMVSRSHNDRPSFSTIATVEREMDGKSTLLNTINYIRYLSSQEIV